MYSERGTRNEVHEVSLRGGLLDPLDGRRVFPEPVLEPPRHVLKVAHPSRAGRLSALCLLAPLVRAKFCCRIAALGASFVLPVEGTVAAPAAEGVGLGVSLTERRRSFCLCRFSKGTRKRPRKTTPKTTIFLIDIQNWLGESTPSASL